MTHETPGSVGAGRPTILIVDDEEVVRSAFQLYFETVGYRVAVADGGEKALEILRERHGSLDVVLLDLVMPGMHGIDVLRRVKEIDGSVEVIIATGCGSMTSAIEALRHGAYDYVTKPVINLEEDLLSVVRAALASRHGKLGERSKQKPSAPPPFSAPRSDREIEFYKGVESLVIQATDAEMAHDEGALAALGGFLSSQLDATAALALSRGIDGRLSCLAQWGELAHIAEGPLLDIGAFVWQRLLSSPACWVRLEPGSIELPAHPAASLDALLVPLLVVPEKTSTSCDRECAALIVVRSTGPGEATAPPGAAILGFVAGSILSQRARACLAHESR